MTVSARVHAAECGQRAPYARGGRIVAPDVGAVQSGAQRGPSVCQAFLSARPASDRRLATASFPGNSILQQALDYGMLCAYAFRAGTLAAAAIARLRAGTAHPLSFSLASIFSKDSSERGIQARSARTGSELSRSLSHGSAQGLSLPQKVHRAVAFFTGSRRCVWHRLQ